ncbi:hypothetical protein [uncultured Lacinutrix sp.]|uniref:hypothetical protein n=1 Tax=uncultured Lacinutrix sp. TaxID=574032 RepID=UPI00260D27E1|nr:hypothetical protein [uncultured Lacinutrix sp.]
MEQPIIIFIILLVTGVLLFLGYYYSKKNTILRELKKTRKKQIPNVKENEYAKVIGKALHVHEPLIAPLSGRKCVYYYVHIQKKGDKSWHTFIKEEQAQDFFIEVNSEMAIIKPDNFPKKTFVVEDFKTKSGSFNDATPELERFLNKHGKESKGFFGFNRQLRYKEGIIELQENIAVKGIGKWKPLKEPIEGYNYSKILTLTGTENKKLIITDLPEGLKRVDNRL